MKSEIGRFERIISQINIVYGLQIPVSTLTLFAVVLWIFRPSFFQVGALPIYVAMILIVAVASVIHSSLSQKLSKRQLAMIYACYHGALIIFTFGVAPFLTPFEFLWISLAIGVDVIFGKKPMTITLIVYGLTLLATYFRTEQTFSLELLLLTLGQYLGVVFISSQVSRYRTVSDEEREVLDTLTTKSSFERQRLLSLINNMGEAVIATDENGKILLYNAAVLNLLDTNETLEGKPIDKLLHLRDKNKHKHKVMSLIAENPVGITSTDYLHAYNTNDMINIYLNVAAVKLGFKEESESGYIVIMRDITREKSLEEERDEFISVVSHELRTPVAISEGNISNAIYMATNSKSKDEITSALAQAHKQVIFLANMINDLATLSRAERTDVEIELVEVDPTALILGLGDDYAAAAKEKKLKLTATTAKETKPINTSELYLREVLQNFITNAIKYTKKGAVLVHVRSNSKGDAVFSVTDTGIGLSKADQQRVFDKFFRSEDFRTRESSGTGLGLYVTAKLAKRLGATIEVESQLNKGTTFTITVPSLKPEEKEITDNSK